MIKSISGTRRAVFTVPLVTSAAWSISPTMTIELSSAPYKIWLPFSFLSCSFPESPEISMPSYCLNPLPMPFAASFTYTVGTDTHCPEASAHCLMVCRLPDVSSQYCPFDGLSGCATCEKLSVSACPSARHSDTLIGVSAASTVFSCPMNPLSE